jgi:hypothetical protein
MHWRPLRQLDPTPATVSTIIASVITNSASSYFGSEPVQNSTVEVRNRHGSATWPPIPGHPGHRKSQLRRSAKPTVSSTSPDKSPLRRDCRDRAVVKTKAWRNPLRRNAALKDSKIFHTGQLIAEIYAFKIISSDY